MGAIVLTAIYLVGAVAAYAAEVSGSPPAASTEMITPNRAFELVNALAILTGMHDETVGRCA